jgi:hypothetical protein
MRNVRSLHLQQEDECFRVLSDTRADRDGAVCGPVPLLYGLHVRMRGCAARRAALRARVHGHGRLRRAAAARARRAAARTVRAPVRARQAAARKLPRSMHVIHRRHTRRAAVYNPQTLWAVRIMKFLRLAASPRGAHGHLLTGGSTFPGV